MQELIEEKRNISSLFSAIRLIITLRKGETGQVLRHRCSKLYSGIDRTGKWVKKLAGKSLRFLMILAGISYLIACTDLTTPITPKLIDTPSNSAGIHNTARLIIKFYNQPSTSEISKKLGEITAQTGIKFGYVRKMSGDAHVIIAQNIASDDRLIVLLNDINKRDDVEYVEKDVVMQQQKNNQLNMKQSGAMQ